MLENAGDRPERAIDFVALHQPQKVVFIDAAEFGAKAGTVRWIKTSELTERSLSSHRLPLAALIDWIESEHPTSCHCLGIQVGSMQLGEGLTPEVAKTAAEIIDWFATVPSFYAK
jgi:hydrogenase 3 maturation protease